MNPLDLLSTLPTDIQLTLLQIFYYLKFNLIEFLLFVVLLILSILKRSLNQML